MHISQQSTNKGRKETLTLIVARRTPADVNAVSADVRLVASFMRFNSSMAVFSEERASSSPLGCLDLSAMVETQGGGVSKSLSSITGMSACLVDVNAHALQSGRRRGLYPRS